MACAALLSVTKADAEEKPNQIFTSLSSTTISGYVSTSAQWTSSTAPLPDDYRSFPIVFVTGPKVFREGSNSHTGVARVFQFAVHRKGGSSNEITVYLNFHSPGGVPVQGGVTIPAGARKATCTWTIADNGVPDGPRTFTASIDSDPVRLQMPGARYKLSPRWPHSATVFVLDPANRHR